MKQQLQAVIPFEAIPFYPFNWLDELLENRIDPGSMYYHQPSDAELNAWRQDLTIELNRVNRVLKEQTFGLFTSTKVRPIVTAYLEATDELISLAGQHLAHPSVDEALAGFLEMARDALTQLRDKVARRYARFLPEPMARPEGRKPSGPAFKLWCKLSADQLGLILKAADDTKLLVSRSISLVFRTLVPFLSTPQKVDLSWQSVRSNAYHPEQQDKDAAIAALEALIRVIRGYR